MLFTTCVILSFATSAFAYDNVSSINICSDTIITKDNIEEVLEYVGLSKDSYTDNTTMNANTVYTVGELQKAIAESAKIKSSLRNSSKFKSSLLNSSDSSLNLKTSAKGKSKTVSRTVYYGQNDSFYITYRATGYYSGSKWTGVGSA